MSGGESGVMLGRGFCARDECLWSEACFARRATLYAREIVFGRACVSGYDGKVKRGLLCLWAVLSWLFGSSVAQAAEISALTVRMTRQGISAASDHQVRFTVANGVATPTDTITLTYSSGFSLAALTVSDIDLFHGPTTGLETQETLASSAALGGIWGVSITGNVITFSPPMDAVFNEIATGEVVTVRIGTNAGGTNQITNPGTAGTYGLQIGGVFGGSGLARIPIVATARSGFGVSFTVPAASAGGGGDGGGGGGGVGAVTPPPPVVPPVEPMRPIVILNVEVPVITERAAQVKWETDRPAATTFSLRGPDGIRSLTPRDEGTRHVIDLSGLTPGTEYFFKIGASAAGALSSETAEVSFRTLPEPLENVSGFSAQRTITDPQNARLTWIWPPALRGTGAEVVIVARADRFPSSITDGREVYRGTGSETTDRPGSGMVFYVAYARSGARVSSGAVAQLAAIVVTPPIPPPVPARPTPEPTLPVPPAPTPVSPTGPTSPPSVPPAVPGSVGSPTVPPGPAGGAVEPSPGVTPVIPTAPDAVLPPTSGAGLPASIGEMPTADSGTAEGILTWEWRTSGGLILARGSDIPRVLTGDSVELVVSATREVLSGIVEVDGSRYALARTGERRYAVAFVPSERVGGVGVQLVARFADGTERRLSGRVQAVGAVAVLERDEEERPAIGAQAELFARRGSAWVAIDGSRRTLGADGVYRQYLETGLYRLEVSKEGWRTLRKEVRLAAAGPLQDRVVLEKGPQNPLAAIDPEAGLAQNVANVAEATVESVAQTIEQVRTPESQAVAQIVAPAAVAAAATVTVAAASSFNAIAYARFFFLQPFLLWRRRRREKWGLVYNALTKQPIDLAIVRLLDTKTNQVRQTRITDAQGRFAFLATPGSYKIQVVKPGFTFPTSVLASEKIDVDLVDLYHGEAIDAQASVTLTPNIPIDPIEKVEVPQAVIHRKRLRMVQRGLTVGGMVVSIVALIIQPTWLMAGFTIAQFVAYALFRRLAVPPKPKNWGIVYDKVSRKPLGRVIVRIFDKKYNKLLETQVTDRDGKYAFFAGKNIYYVTADHQGYERFVSRELDLRQEAMGVVREPLGLQVKGSVPAQAT